MFVSRPNEISTGSILNSAAALLSLCVIFIYCGVQTQLLLHSVLDDSIEAQDEDSYSYSLALCVGV